MSQAIDTMIERMAEEAHAEIRRLCDLARIEMGARFAFIRRSRGQVARWAKVRSQKVSK